MAPLALRTVLPSALFVGCLVAGCAELKTAGTGTQSEVAATTPRPTGPGAHGSLPSGYCCTADSECRDRHCAAVGGGHMCLDACRTQARCERPDLAFACDSTGNGEPGFCQPPSASIACIPQATFERGSREVGECCAPTTDGRSGEECDGNKCVSTGINDVDGPYVCSQHCESTSDCPAGTICGEYGTCDPGNFPYTCK